MILQIANDFNLTKVHKELYSHLDKLNVEQKIFVPLRNEKQIGKNHFEFESKASEIIYSKKINLIHRAIFSFKIKVLYKSLLKKINVQDIHMTHATTLFSDGAIAYRLYKDYNVPYIVAVRNTDINFYLNKRKKLIPLGIEILKNAQKIIFISEANKEFFLKKTFINNVKDALISKIKVINNGIDNYWLDNKQRYLCANKSNDFLFIGRFDKNKNVENLIDALIMVRQSDNLPIKLHLVGGTGINHQKVLNKISSLKWITYHGTVFEKEKLRDIFNASGYFSMISHKETFGLVYLEALSQGKPILYTEGQGIDGVFNFEVGEKVNSYDLVNISYQIKKMINNRYEKINEIDFNNFRWSFISQKYKQIYNEK